MEFLQQSFTVQFNYNVYFTSSLFDASNKLLIDSLTATVAEGSNKKIFFVVDSGVAETHPSLSQNIKTYFANHSNIQLIENILVIPGGEQSKNEERYFTQIIHAINNHGIDRHSFIAAIGGGAILDL